MLVKDLDGNEHKLKITSGHSKNKSKLHKTAIETIKQIVPGTSICEDLPIKVCKGKTLYLDIFLPRFEMAIEVHGKQHYQFVPHYHGYEHRFGRAKLNDDLKKEWCELNSIFLVELAYNESTEWDGRIREAIRLHTGQLL